MVFGRKKNPYEEISEKILSISESPTLSILNTLLTLKENKKRYGAVFTATKIFGLNYGIHLTDYGFIGIGDRIVEGLMYPGDANFYVSPDKLKTGDIVLCIYLDENGENFSLYHAKALSFKENNVEIQTLVDGDVGWINTLNIIGKLWRVVQFNSDEWKEIFDEIGDKDWLKGVLEELIKNTKKEEIVEELKYRLENL